jgi:16S rRNA (cytosine1402-N4)-methyltransferase
MVGREAHVPVMLREMLEAIAPRDDGCYVDGTFGGGGYTRALLEACDGVVYAFDRDPAAIAAGEELAAAHKRRLTLILDRFSHMEDALAARGVDAVDGVALDIGVSSMQLDDAARGFSFTRDGPLDMRMSASGPTAADLVNSLSEDDLADIIRTYGEERSARRIARAIVKARAHKPIARTLELSEIIVAATGSKGASRIHPATRTFQALRIYLNDELGELERGLSAAERVLRPSGRLVVVAFHSLEDRIVKRFLAERSGKAGAVSRHQPETRGRAPSFRLPPAGARKPQADEIAANPRARSARLRAGERTTAPAWPAAEGTAR